MEIKEVKELIAYSDIKALRPPVNMLEDSFEKMDKVGFLQYVIEMLFKTPKNVNFLNRLINKEWYYKSNIKRMEIVKSLTGKGTMKVPYILDTVYGSGELFDARDIIGTDTDGFVDDGKFHCYHNSNICAKLFTKRGIECKQISGICFCKDWNILHSVVKFKYNNKWYILDYNYKYVMEADLYLKLFSFEILCEIEGKDLVQNEDLINDFMRFCNHRKCSIDDRIIALAYDVIIERAKKKNEQIIFASEIFGKKADKLLEDILV